jgi:uncharacterized membrane protein YhhN
VPTTPLAIVCGLGVAHLVAYYSGHRAIAGTLKALPIVVLAGLMWLATKEEVSALAPILAVGFLFSAVGDVSLVFRRGFLPGLSAFFLAHCCYIRAFAPGAVATVGSAMAAVAIAVVAGAMLRRLWPHVSRLRVPVIAYAGVLSLMTWCAVARATAPGASTAAYAGAIGAASFLVSDGVLAFNRFARPFSGAHAAVMITYYAAQILIARAAL